MGDVKGSPAPNNVCGDCSAPEPEWASLNRGILLCKECSSIHRSLGQQYSRVKFLKDAGWTQSLRAMLTTLSAGPANHVWEHLLLNPNKSSDASVKKPSPTDSLDVKRKFIHLKHFVHQYVFRPNSDPFDVRNQELHSTVRTGALDTTLRLLASGADPNFFHPEKGTTPMHVAARNGQALQTELLFLHGAHMDAADYLGQTPVEHALAAGHKDLAQRIMELRYFLTDHLSYFVCSEMPDHSSAKHILIPTIRVANPKQEEALRNLAANVLEQLAADLYDEVDRRQLEKYVSATAMVKSPTDFNKFSIAFLPVNPNFSSVRNQTRQKFARLSNDEICALITLVLVECKRRHCNGFADVDLDRDIFLHDDQNNLNASAGKASGSNLEDDDYPLYDSVASDDDHVLAEQQTILAQQKAPFDEAALSIKMIQTSERNAASSTGSKISEYEAKIQELQDENFNLKQEMAVLKKMITNTLRDAMELKADVFGRSDVSSNSFNGSLSNGYTASSGNRNSQTGLPNGRLKTTRPSSMCESVSLRYEDSVTPIRNCNTEASLEKGCDMRRYELIQTTTKKIVELIKVLIDHANSCVWDGVTNASNKIYQETQDMATALLLKEDNCSLELKQNLENVMLQVLRMKSEVPLLNENSDNGKIISQMCLQKIKKLCFDVGAGMKQLLTTGDLGSKSLKYNYNSNSNSLL